MSLSPQPLFTNHVYDEVYILWEFQRYYNSLFRYLTNIDQKFYYEVSSYDLNFEQKQ